jgi:acetyl esterase
MNALCDSQNLAAPLGRLVSACRPHVSSTLIVWFNVYSHKAHANPELPHQTRFDAMSRILPYAAHAAWMVEEQETWYIAHQDAIVDRIETYVREKGISVVKLAGNSAGGYAAIRTALMLDQRLGGAAAIVAFAVKPQTGVSHRLMGSVYAEMREAGWDPRLLGENPILPPPPLIRRYAPLDLAEQANLAAPHNLAVVLMNDEGNPIERAFSRDILDWPFLYHAPQHWGLGHGEGCEEFFKGPFWEAFDAVYPLEIDAEPARGMVGWGDGPFIRLDVAEVIAREAASGNTPLTDLPVAVARQTLRDWGYEGDLAPVPLAVVRDLACPGPAGDIPMRFYDQRAERQASPVILYFHGGGFTYGDLASHDALCRSIADQTDLPVLAVDYRLAPEHPFPAFADDAEASARWLADQAGVTGIITAGDSAGGHLAILVAQRLGVEPAAQPVLAQWALYPYVGGGYDWDSMRRYGVGYGLTRAAMQTFDAYCGDPHGDQRYSLALGPIPLTPLLVQTASLDPLHDQGVDYARRVREAGARVVHLEAEGMIHGYATLRRVMPSAACDVKAFLRAGLAMLNSA